MNHPLALVVLLCAGVLGAGIVSQQGQPVPGPGSGVMSVAGTVTVANQVGVTATQSGEWRVGVASLPAVTVASPSFVKTGGRYEITWTGQERDDVVVVAVATDGWVSVRQNGGIRWINLSLARAVREL